MASTSTRTGGSSRRPIARRSRSSCSQAFGAFLLQGARDRKSSSITETSHRYRTSTGTPSPGPGGAASWGVPCARPLHERGNRAACVAGRRANRRGARASARAVGRLRGSRKAPAPRRWLPPFAWPTSRAPPADVAGKTDALGLRMVAATTFGTTLGVSVEDSARTMKAAFRGKQTLVLCEADRARYHPSHSHRPRPRGGRAPLQPRAQAVPGSAVLQVNATAPTSAAPRHPTSQPARRARRRRRSSPFTKTNLGWPMWLKCAGATWTSTRPPG